MIKKYSQEEYDFIVNKLYTVIEDWRIELAKNIAKNNPKLSIYNLNTVVQKIIDRIIFIRIAEDRGIEDEDLLKSITKVDDIYERLNHIFTKVNVKYNSEIFLIRNGKKELKKKKELLLFRNMFRDRLRYCTYC